MDGRLLLVASAARVLGQTGVLGPRCGDPREVLMRAAIKIADQARSPDDLVDLARRRMTSSRAIALVSLTLLEIECAIERAICPRPDRLVQKHRYQRLAS